MADPKEFGALFTEGLLKLVAHLVAQPEYEVYRRYETDAQFHAVVSAIVFTAVQVLKEIQSDEYVEQVDIPRPPTQPTSGFQDAFRSEVSDLLGWDNRQH